MRSALLYKPLVAYFALSYVISWSILLLGAMLAPGSPLGILASTFGPLLAALALTLAEAGWGGVRALLGRATRWRVRSGGTRSSCLATDLCACRPSA